MTLLRRLWCALFGHDWAACYDGTSTFAWCDRCGREERGTPA